VVAKTWTTLSDTEKSIWTCIDCRNTSNTTTSNKEYRSRKHSTSSEESVASADKRIKRTDDQLEPRSEHNNMASIDEIKTLLQESLNPILSKLADIDEKYVTKVGKLEEDILELQKSRDHDAQYSRTNEVVITNIPKIPGEKLMDTLARIIHILKVPLDIKDLNAFHWNPSRKQGSQPTFLLDFLRRWQKTDFIIAARKLKPTAALYGGNPNTKIYISEHLTQATLKLLMKARQLKDHGYLPARTMDCKVFVRKNIPGPPNIRIMNEEQVNKMKEEAVITR